MHGAKTESLLRLSIVIFLVGKFRKSKPVEGKKDFNEYMFCDATVFNQPMGAWNTSCVTAMESTMDGMFFSAAEFNQPIGSWDTSNVLHMNSLFHKAVAFNQPISEWNTSRVWICQIYFPKYKLPKKELMAHKGCGCIAS